MNHMDPTNNEVIEFVKMYNFSQLENNCYYWVEENFYEAHRDDDSERETKMYMSLSDGWINELLSQVSAKTEGLSSTSS